MYIYMYVNVNAYINAWMDGCMDACMCMGADVCILGRMCMEACMYLCIAYNDLLITAFFSFSGAVTTQIAVYACLPNHSAHTLSLKL